MNKNVILSGIMGAVLLFGPLVCHAEKWDKNDYADATIMSGFYDVDSIKVKDKTVSWTEKYLLTDEGTKNITKNISKYDACKQNIAKKSSVTQFQLDYQIEKGKIRGVAKRYYNKSSELICSDKDMGKDFDTSWGKIKRNSPQEKAKYDLVTKYKVKFPN